MDTATSSLVVRPAFWQVVSRAVPGPEVFLLELVQALGYVVPGSVCEEHIDDLSQVVTNASRWQLSHDAALIGKAVKDGPAKLGLTLSCKSTPLANSKSLGKLIVSHLGAEGVCLGAAATNCSGERGNVRQTDGSASGKADEGQRESIAFARRTQRRKSGIHPVHIHGHTAQGASTAQVNARCKNLRMDTVMGKTQACASSTVAWFFGEKRVPQTATRVEQVSEWMTMWRGFIVDTRCKIRKVWRKRLLFCQETPTLEPSYRSNLCHRLLGVGGWLEAEHTRFLANARRQCHYGRRFVQQGADHRQFLQ